MGFFALAAILPGLVLSCGQPRPQTGMQLAQAREYEAQKREREVWVFETDMGEIVILPLPQAAEQHVRQIKNLIDRGFYDGLTFHYVVPGSMIQGGDINTRDDDPSNDGTGDPGFTIPPEFNAPNLRGSVGLAHPPGEPEQGNSQFYILLEDKPELNGRYTVFGIVVEGIEVVEEISETPADENGHPEKRIEIIRAYSEERFV